jgi:hypothetical protein
MRSGLPQLSPTERPRCPTCRERMDLQRIDPGIRGFENRVFECGKCYTMKTVPAAIDRIKSPCSKWAESRLRNGRWRRAGNSTDKKHEGEAMAVHRGNRWTSAEDDQLRQLIAKKTSITVITAKLKRSSEAVRMRMFKLRISGKARPAGMRQA